VAPAAADEAHEGSLPGADTNPEPADPGYAMTIMDLFDAGWGPRLVSVTAPDGAIAPGSKLDPKNMGKAPGRLTSTGWTGVDLNNSTFRCHGRPAAQLWTKWGANAGIVAGAGFVMLDNDEGKAVDQIIARECLKVLGPKIALLRRSVRSPSHKRSAFLFRVLNFVGDPAVIGNQNLKFECAGVKAELQVLAQRKQLVVAGTHPGTRAPYVLSRRVTSISDIPAVSADQFNQIVKAVVAGIAALGWTMKETSTAKATPGARPGPLPGAKASNIGDFEEVVWILERLPNRDAPPGDRTDWDEFLDDYDEYIKVLYAICGALGDAPEVKALAMGWANGRVQIKQSAENAWASIVNNNPGLGMRHLGQLAWRFIGKEYISRWPFPDLSPEEQAEIETWAKAEPPHITLGFRPLTGFLAEYKPLRYIIEPLLAAEGVYTLTGRTGHAKTCFLVIAALAVVTGRQDLLGLEVSAGRVAYLSFENPNDVRMRFAVAAHRLGIDPDAIGDALMILPYHASPEKIARGLKELSASGGPFSLVIVDTLQAAFDGKDFNQNKEVLDFVRRQRRLTELPGGLCVVIAAHPVKKAEKTDLIPYGGGSILNEVDGNLTIWKEETGTIDMHWQGKFRGVDFDPKFFDLEITDAPAILDTKGQRVRIPVLRPLTAAGKAAKDRNHMDTRTALLQAMLTDPDKSQTAWAWDVGRDRSQVSRTLKDLAKDGLVAETGGKWVVTAKGQRHVVAAAAAAKRKGEGGGKEEEEEDERV
jgi:hypothetical protein